MAAASDKARFYLEQYVPELQDHQRKNLLSPAEIRAIARKRSDFEHTLNARGSAPADFARYAAYESNLASLIRKRCKRLGVKQASTHSHQRGGARTVFFILERGTQKFPGDLALWTQYIEFCQRQKASKKLAKAFTSVLRLKPREWGLWVLAAKHYAEGQGDMATARSYMQRGLRFCKDEKRLWVEYVRLEMVYLAKLAARRKILGLDDEGRAKESEVTAAEEQDETADVMTLPTLTAEDIDPDANKGMQEVDAARLQRMSSAPALTGAIPLAIFDAAMEQFQNRGDVAEDVFEAVVVFDQVPSARKTLNHILDHMRGATDLNGTETLFCEARLALFAVDAQSAEFPEALGACLVKLGQSVKQGAERKRARRAEKAALVLLPFWKLGEELQEDVVAVIRSKIREFMRSTDSTAVTARLRKEGQEADAAALESALGVSPMDES